MARSISTIKAEQVNLLAKQKQADKDAQNKIYDTYKKTINDNYTQAIKDGEAEYEDSYRENAVQKKVNEFYIAEEMANMGLTNSGLNRTQITANQLSYANNKAEIDRKRQSMVDGLKREMTAKLTENENERTSVLAGIDSSYDNTATERANEIYKDELAADTARQNAYYSALSKMGNNNPHATIISTKYYNGEIAEDVGGLGYMGKDNNGVKYQPRGVYITDSNGNKKAYKLNETGKTVKEWFKESDVTNSSGVNVAKQKVWEANGQYFIWNGTKNQYERIG